MLTQKNQIHFKMYKSGKFWLVSGVALITFGLGNSLDIPTNSGNSVSADSVNTSLNNANSDQGNSQKAQSQTEQLPDESKVVTETIHYQYSDGTPAADDYTRQITFTRTVSKNLNTQETSYGDWKSNSATFSSVKSPEIPGYTADQQEISIHDSNVESNDKNFTVTYHKESDNNVDARNLQLKTATNNIKESQIDKQSIDIQDSNGDIKSLSSNSNSIQLPSAQFSPKNINFSGRINNYNSGDSITIPFSISNVSNSSQATWAAVQKDIPGVGYISFVADQQNYSNGTYSGKYVIHVTHDISTEKSYTVSLGAGLFINSYDSTKPISIKLGTDNYTITPTPREYPKDDSNFYGSGWLARVAPNQINASTGTWDSNYYNNLLSSNGENIGNTNIPTGDFVTIQHVKSINGNIINVAKDSEYTTSLSFSKDGSELIKNDNSAIYHSNILGTEVHLDVNMTDIDIAKQLAQYGNNSYAVIKNSDGSYTVAYNYGNLLKRNGFSMMDYYQNKVGTVSNSDQSPENKRDDTTDSKINNSLADKQSLRNQNDFKFIFQDPTMENVLTASTSFFNVTDNEASLISPVTSDKNNTIPNDSLAAGQTEIKVSYVDDYGNPLTTDDVYFGYPQDVDSSVNAHPSENPVINTKSISGYSLVTDQSVSPSWLKTSDIWLNSTSNNIAFPLSSSHSTVQQVYFVYTKNAPTVTTETKTITRTIKYVDAVDGHEVANEVQQPVTLTRTVTT
ncbi:mucin-binding protein, partial [Fructobacillus cardui]|uniref:mucin-binding protein n=1 Tax=Fructobacillus cardui TaxID=2893170 RepID=UPI0030C7E532